MLGRGLTRTQLSAITPRMPSEPIRARSGRGAGAGARQPAAPPIPSRGDRPHGLDQVVDVGVERREVTAGAGGDPAAQGRELERLWEMAKRQPVLAQLPLEPGPGRARLDPRRKRDRVDLEHARSMRRRSRQTPGDRPAGPRRRRRRSCRRRMGTTAAPSVLRPAQHRLDLGLVARQGDQVRRVREFAPESADDIAI